MSADAHAECVVELDRLVQFVLLDTDQPWMMVIVAGKWLAEGGVLASEPSVDAHLDAANLQPLRAQAMHKTQVKQAVLAEIRLNDPHEHMHAHRQASSAGQELIGLYLFSGDDNVVDAGDTAVGAFLQLDGNALGK